MPPRLERFADQMRREPTRAESLLYNALLVAFEPYDAQVKCQERVSYYIADFMIYPARLVVEVDGGYHATDKAHAYDNRRESSMRGLGINTLRFRNQRVFDDIRGVVAEVLIACAPLSPKRQGEVQITQCPPAYAAGGKRRKPSMIERHIAAFNSYRRRQTIRAGK